MTPSLILLVEDDQDLGKVLRRALQQQYPEPETHVLWATSLRDAITLVSYDTPDMIFLDLRLPDSPEQDTLSSMKKYLPHDVPVLVLSGYYSSIEGLSAIAAGADDFILKGTNCIQDLHMAASKAWARVMARRSYTSKP